MAGQPGGPRGIEREKQVAAEAAAELVEDGMTVGLGTGSTVAFLLPALARRSLDIVCAATSPRTEYAARELGLRIEDVASIDRFDITIDGADQIAPDGWLVKGRGRGPVRRHRRLDQAGPGSAQPDPPRAALLRAARHDAPGRTGLAARRPAQPRRRRDRGLPRAGG